MIALETRDEVKPASPDFAAALHRHGCVALRREAVRTVQVNVGKRCNQAACTTATSTRCSICRFLSAGVGTNLAPSGTWIVSTSLPGGASRRVRTASAAPPEAGRAAAAPWPEQ
jgi:hypothetical protein